VEEVGPKTLRLARQLETAKHRQHLLEPNAKLEAREVGAKAVVRAPEPEGEVAVRLACDVEPPRVGKMILVAVA
jgi:hypothetical protein